MSLHLPSRRYGCAVALLMAAALLLHGLRAVRVYELWRGCKVDADDALLLLFYEDANLRGFGGALPPACVRWSGSLARRGFNGVTWREDGRYYIAVSDELRGNPRLAAMVVIHEAAHVPCYDATITEMDAHGPCWQQTMRRLAVRGVMEPFW